MISIKIPTLICCSLLAAIFPLMTQAQERAAGGTTETQMTWTALKSQVDTARAESTAAHTRIDKIQVCSKKQMIYVPNAAGADADDCINNAKLENVITCGKSGMVFNGTKCIDPEAESIACAKKNLLYNGKDCVVSIAPKCKLVNSTVTSRDGPHGSSGGECPDGTTAKLPIGTGHPARDTTTTTYSCLRVVCD